MGHRQDMTPQQRLKWDCDNYKKRLEANRGSNFEYWNDKHEEMLKRGWDLFLMKDKAMPQYATASEYHAKKYVEQLRSEGNYARIVCGYEKNIQRVKMYSIIYRPRPIKNKE